MVLIDSIGLQNMYTRVKFKWTAINDAHFEDLVLHIVNSKNAVRAEFRKGPGDKGQDIEAIFRNRDALGLETDDVYFVEAKHHEAGVSPDHISGALAWAQAEQPSVMVLAASSHFTNPCRENIKAWNRNNPNIKVIIWRRKEIQDLILASGKVRDFAISIGLLPQELSILLPSELMRLRPGEGESEIGLEMPYRYWLSEDDVDKLKHVASFIDGCGEIFDELGVSEHYFETTSLGIPNWITWLHLMHAQCMLDLAIRDYLHGQTSGAAPDLLAKLANSVRDRVKIVDEIGGSSFYVD